MENLLPHSQNCFWCSYASMLPDKILLCAFEGFSSFRKRHKFENTRQSKQQFIVFEINMTLIPLVVSFGTKSFIYNLPKGVRSHRTSESNTLIGYITLAMDNNRGTLELNSLYPRFSR